MCSNVQILKFKLICFSTVGYKIMQVFLYSLSLLCFMVQVNEKQSRGYLALSTQLSKISDVFLIAEMCQLLNCSQVSLSLQGGKNKVNFESFCLHKDMF